MALSGRRACPIPRLAFGISMNGLTHEEYSGGGNRPSVLRGLSPVDIRPVAAVRDSPVTGRQIDAIGSLDIAGIDITPKACRIAPVKWPLLTPTADASFCELPRTITSPFSNGLWLMRLVKEITGNPPGRRERKDHALQLAM